MVRLYSAYVDDQENESYDGDGDVGIVMAVNRSPRTFAYRVPLAPA